MHFVLLCGLTGKEGFYSISDTNINVANMSNSLKKAQKKSAVEKTKEKPVKKPKAKSTSGIYVSS